MSLSVRKEVKKIIVGMKIQPFTQRMIRDTIWKISRDEYHSGAQLPSIESIAKSYGVARTTVREAIKYMESTGLVYSIHGKGTFITDFIPSPNGVAFLENVIDLRRMIEVFGIKKAAENRTKSDIEELRKLIVEMHKTLLVPKRFLEFDRDFHFLIAKASGNPFIFSIFLNISGMFDSVLDALTHIPDYPFETVLGHHKIMVDAIEARDTQLAEDIMKKHLDYISEKFA
jgi:GntR family transcriptional regulator, transcriptional repressor for pyruvate dehydrogenase complex